MELIEILGLEKSRHFYLYTSEFQTVNKHGEFY
jgi:hypothetical protein